MNRVADAINTDFAGITGTINVEAWKASAYALGDVAGVHIATATEQVLAGKLEAGIEELSKAQGNPEADRLLTKWEALRLKRQGLVALGVAQEISQALGSAGNFEKLEQAIASGKNFAQAYASLSTEEAARLAKSLGGRGFVTQLLQISSASNLEILSQQLLALASSYGLSEGHEAGALVIYQALSGGLMGLAKGKVVDDANVALSVMQGKGEYKVAEVVHAARGLQGRLGSPNTMGMLITGGLLSRLVKVWMMSRGIGLVEGVNQARAWELLSATTATAAEVTYVTAWMEMSQHGEINWDSYWKTWAHNAVIFGGVRAGVGMGLAGREAVHGMSAAGLATRHLEYLKVTEGIARHAVPVASLTVLDKATDPSGRSWFSTTVHATATTAELGVAGYLGRAAVPTVHRLEAGQVFKERLYHGIARSPQLTRIYQHAGRNLPDFFNNLPGGLATGPQFAMATANGGVLPTTGNDPKLTGLSFFKGKGASSGGGKDSPPKPKKGGLILDGDAVDLYRKALKEAIDQTRAERPGSFANVNIPDSKVAFEKAYDRYAMAVEMALTRGGPELRRVFQEKIQAIRDKQFVYVDAETQERLPISTVMARGRVLDIQTTEFTGVLSNGYKIQIYTDTGRVLTGREELIAYIDQNTATPADMQRTWGPNSAPQKRWNQAAANAMKRVISRATQREDGIYIDWLANTTPVLMLGASGAYGRPIVEALLAGGATVYAPLLETDPSVITVNAPFLGVLHTMTGVDMSRDFANVATTMAAQGKKVNVLDLTYADGPKSSLLSQARKEMVRRGREQGWVDRVLAFGSPTVPMEIDTATGQYSRLRHNWGPYEGRSQPSVSEVSVPPHHVNRYVFDGTVTGQKAAYMGAQTVDKGGEGTVVLTAPALWSRSVVAPRALVPRLVLSNAMFGSGKKGLQDVPLPREADQLMFLVTVDQLTNGQNGDGLPKVHGGVITAGPRSGDVATGIALRYWAQNLFRARPYEKPPRPDLLAQIPTMVEQGGTWQASSPEEFYRVAYALTHMGKTGLHLVDASFKAGPLAQAIAGTTDINRKPAYSFYRGDTNLTAKGQGLMKFVNWSYRHPTLGKLLFGLGPIAQRVAAKQGGYGSVPVSLLYGPKSFKAEEEVRFSVAPGGKLTAAWVETPNGTVSKLSVDTGRESGLVHTLQTAYGVSGAPTYSTRLAYDPATGALRSEVPTHINRGTIGRPRELTEKTYMDVTSNLQREPFTKAYGQAPEGSLAYLPLLFFPDALKALSDPSLGVDITATVVDRIVLETPYTGTLDSTPVQAHLTVRSVQNAATKTSKGETKRLGELARGEIAITQAGKLVGKATIDVLVRGNKSEDRTAGTTMLKRGKPGDMYGQSCAVTSAFMTFNSRLADLNAANSGVGDANLIHLDPLVGKTARLGGTVVAGISAIAQIEGKLRTEITSNKSLNDIPEGYHLVGLEAKFQKEIRHGETVELRYGPQRGSLGWNESGHVGKYQVVRKTKTGEEVLVSGQFTLAAKPK